MSDQANRPYSWAIALALALVTFAVYWPVRQFEYTNFDDQDYVYENPHVMKGLTQETVRWAFTTGFAANWHPLTWLSLMLDCEFFGVNPGAHHLMNVVYHVGATVLLFAALAAMTGGVRRSGMVAALFALHPLHVESVAWVAERKDVLSGFFWMLTMVAYAWYARRPGIIRYLGVVSAFALGLMAKPMLVTLPCVLLLLDYWPLNRLQSLGKAVLEKLPLFALTIVSCVITFLAQQKGGAVESFEKYPFLVRVCNALVAYATYLVKTFLPEDLAVLYPHPGTWRFATVAGAGMLLVIASVAALVFWHSKRYSVVGWLWYLGTLVPVIGIIQVGQQYMADRYSYIPLIGIFIILVWGACDLAQGLIRPKLALGTAAAIVLAVCVVATSRQLQHWRNSITLFAHTVSVTRSNATAHYNLGQALSVRGFTKEALPHYERAIALRTNYTDAHNNLGLTLAMMGKLQDATNHYTSALHSNPSNAAAHVNFGFALLRLGQPTDAASHFERALALESPYPLTHDGLGQAYLDSGKVNEAIVEFHKALALDSTFSEARFHLSKALTQSGKLREAEAQLREAAKISPQVPDIQAQLGLVLNAQGRPKEAIEAYRHALRLNPQHIEGLNNLAWLLATHRNPEFRNGLHAVEYAERACELTAFKTAALIGTLAAAHAEAGQFEEAQKRAKQAEELARSEGQNELADRNRKLLELYAARKPYHEG